MRKITVMTVLLAPAMLAGLGVGCGPGVDRSRMTDRLTVYNWEEYLAPETIPAFEKEFGVTVDLKTYEDERVMLEQLKEKPEEYDIVVPSDSVVEEMITLGLLAPIDLEVIPNFKYVADRFKGLHYDPQNGYSIPYMWGTTGIALNTKRVPEGGNSWQILWNPAYQGRMSMLNSPDEVIGAALKYLGYGLTTIDPAELEKAGAILLEQKPLLAGYMDPQQIKEKMKTEELWVAHCYSGDALMIAREKPEIRYVIPKEGAEIWVDNFCIPANAKNKYTAEVFIDFCLRPQVSAGNANFVRYANTNEGAREYTDPAILKNPSLYPPPEVIDRCQLSSLETLPGITEIRDGIWKKLTMKGGPR